MNTPQVGAVYGDPAKPETWTRVLEVNPCGMGYFVTWQRFGHGRESNSSDWKAFAGAPGIDRLTAALADREGLECDLRNAAKCVRYRAAMLRDTIGWGVHADDLEALAARLEAAMKGGGE